jgi:hypothetical protein
MPAEEYRRLLLIFFFVFFFILRKIAVFGGLGLFFIVIVVVIIVFRNHVQMNRMDLRHLKLRLALRATKNLPLLDFVFIDVDFGGTFRAADHGSVLRSVSKTGAA